MSKLLDYLAPWWSRLGIGRDLANATGQPFDAWRAMLTQLPSYFEAQGAPVLWLDWLMGLVGYYPTRGLSEVRKRSLIEGAGEIWRAKGTGLGLETYVLAIAGINSQVVDSNTYGFVAGISLAGDICGAGTEPWFFMILAPYAVAAEISVEALTEPVTPAFCAYLVNYL